MTPSDSSGTSTPLYVGLAIDMGPAQVYHPNIFDNGDDWPPAPYPVTLAAGGTVDVIRYDPDGSLVVFVSLHTTFGIAGATNSSQEVNFLDMVSTSIVPITPNPLPVLDQTFVPMTGVGTANYSFTSGITIGGSISGNLQGSDKGPSGGGTASFNASYTSSNTVSTSLADIASRTNQVGQSATWIFSVQNVYWEAKASPYDPSDSNNSAKHGVTGAYNQPPLAAQSALAMSTQGIWKLPAGTGGKLVFGVVLQARVLHGHVFRSWCNTSYTWISQAPAFFTLDLDAGTVTPYTPTMVQAPGLPPMPPPELLQMVMTLGGDFHVDGERERVG